MPDAINLGTLFADVKLDISKLAAARQTVGVELKAIGDNLGRIATEAEKSGKRVEESLFSAKQKEQLQKQKAALAAQKQVFADYASGITNVLGGAFAGLVAGSAAVVKMSADFNQSMTSIQNNTTMTDRDLREMKQTVLSLGKESGAGFDDLAQGYMHVANFGNDAAQSTKILRVAMEASVATGAKTADTANILAASLHMFGLSGDDATKAMNVLHLAAAEGNMTLEEFTAASGQAFAFGSQLGLTLTDVSAAFSALTRNGFSAAEAGTQVKAMFTHITEPAKKAQEEIEHLRKTTGVDLTQDFTAAGLKARGLAGVLQDIQKATHGDADAIEKLVPAMRGGIGVMSLAGKGGKDLAQILNDLNDGWSGKLDPTTQGYQRSLHNLNTEIAKVTNEIKADFIPAGEKLTPVFESALPVIKETAATVGSVASAFASMPEWLKEIGLELGTTVIAFKGVSSVLDGLGIKLPGLSRIFKNLKTDIGLASTEVDGLTTKLGALEAIGPIAVTAIVSWEIGSKIGNAIADQMQAETDKHLGTAQASKNSKQLTADRDLLAKDPSKLTDDESGRLGDLVDATSTRYGVKASGLFGEYTDADRAKMVDFLNREIKVQKNLEAHRLYGPAFVQRPAAAKQKPAPHQKPPPGGNGDDGDDDGQDDHQTALVTRAQTAVDQAQGAYDDAVAGLREDAPQLSESAMAARIASIKKLSQALMDAQGKLAATKKAGAGDDQEESAAAEYDDALVKENNAARKRLDELGKIKADWYKRDQTETRKHNDEIKRDQAEQIGGFLNGMAGATADLGDPAAFARSWKEATRAMIDAGDETRTAARNDAQFMVAALEEAGQKGTLAWEIYVEEIKALDKEIAADNKAMAREIAQSWGSSLAGVVDSVRGMAAAEKKSVKDTQAEAKQAAENMRHFWSGVSSDIGKAADQAIEHWRGFHKFFQTMGADVKKILLDIAKELTKNTLMRAFLGDKSGVSKSAPSWGNLGAIFGGATSGTASTPPITGGGSAAVPGGGGGLGSLLGLFGKGGMGGIGGVLGHALPWVGGGLLLNQMLGNPIGKLFKKFKFADGGNIPSHGGYVAESGTRGEWVVPRTPSMALPQRLLDNLGNHAASRALSVAGVRGGGGDSRAMHVHLHVDGATAQQVSSSQLRQWGNQIGWEARKHLATATGEQF